MRMWPRRANLALIGRYGQPATWRAVGLRRREDPVAGNTDPYYRNPLAWIHHRGFAAHPDMCAPGVLQILEPILARKGLLLELGCGSGLLTRHLVDAGHRVVATDASPAMLDLTRQQVPDAHGHMQLSLPDDLLPPADAIVAIGHVLSYLPDEPSIEQALRAIARAVRPGGVIALDLCDLRWGQARLDSPTQGWVGDDWALITEFSVPSPDRFVRQMAAFVKNPDGTWLRDDERHDNVLIDTSKVPELLAEEGVVAEVRSAFGTEALPEGLVAIIGHRPDHGTNAAVAP